MSAQNRFKSLCAAAVLLAVPGLAQADFIDEHTTGFYYEDAIDARRGFGAHYLKQGPEIGALFVAYYTYLEDGSGTPAWYQGVGTVESGDFEVDVTLALVTGGSFGAQIGMPMTEDANWATLTWRQHSCTRTSIDIVSNNVTDTMQETTNFMNLVGGVPSSQCVYHNEFAGCPAFANPGADDRVCIIPAGTITDDIVLTNDTLWALSGQTFIGGKDDPNSTNSITIEPGTRIIGIGEAVLVITTGAKIYAEGAPHAPIVMTGVNTASSPEQPGDAGDWGGLAVNGLSYLNTCPNMGQCTAQGEGDSGTFGGNDPNDSSGIMRYMRVQFAGILFSDTNELNGIALQGVGDRTVFENIEVHDNADDGIEWFGGTVNGRNLALTFVEDDSLDWTMGWNGHVQNVIVYQNPDLNEPSGNLIEADSLEDDNDAIPRAKIWLSNFTMIGRPDSAGIQLRRGTGAHLTNGIVVDSAHCLNIDSDSTFTNAGTPPNMLTDELTIENTIFDCVTNFLDETGAGEPWSPEDLVNAYPGNLEVDPGLDGLWLPEDSPYLRGVNINRTFFPIYHNNFDRYGATPEDFYGWTILDSMLFPEP